MSGDLRGPVLGALALALTGAGCCSTTGPGAGRVETAIEAANPACNLERESQVALGGLKMAVVKALVRLSGDPEEAEILPHIRRVEVTTYRVTAPSACADISWMEAIGEEMTSLGWRPLVVERNGFDSSWVFGHGKKESEFDGLLVVEFGGNELEIVRLDGSIDQFMAAAVAKEPHAVGRLVRASP